MTGDRVRRLPGPRVRARGDESVCEFRIDPAADTSVEAAASRVASESPNGTWAALHADEDELTDLGAVACGIDGTEITVAYPVDLFEAGSMPQILSCIAGTSWE